jgi:cysteine-rich repeat protein
VHILHGNRDAVGIGAMCGDGTLDLEEMCDDGNNIDGDGCSASCTVEVCGNGILDHGEQCDDGNIVSGDGCSATCQVEL